MKRDPYYPTQADWPEIFGMLCDYCSRLHACDVVEGMIEAKDGAQWPEGGWVTDPGAGVTCLSYEPAKRLGLPREQAAQAVREAVPMCEGCAARKGSEASVSLHTRRDFKWAVNNNAMFCCHDKALTGGKERPCGGWAQAIIAKDETLGGAGCRE